MLSVKINSFLYEYIPLWREILKGMNFTHDHSVNIYVQCYFLRSWLLLCVRFNIQYFNQFYYRTYFKNAISSITAHLYLFGWCRTKFFGKEKRNSESHTAYFKISKMTSNSLTVLGKYKRYHKTPSCGTEIH